MRKRVVSLSLSLSLHLLPIDGAVTATVTVTMTVMVGVRCNDPNYYNDTYYSHFHHFRLFLVEGDVHVHVHADTDGVPTDVAAAAD
jgi:hypothetical protein